MRLLLLTALLSLPLAADGPSWSAVDFALAAEERRVVECGGLRLELRNMRRRFFLRGLDGLTLTAAGAGPETFQRLALLPEGGSDGWRQVRDGAVFALAGPEARGKLLVRLHTEGGRLCLARAPEGGFRPGPSGLVVEPLEAELRLRWDAPMGAASYEVYRLPDWGAVPVPVGTSDAPTLRVPAPGPGELLRYGVSWRAADGTASLPTWRTVATPTGRWRYGRLTLRSGEGFSFADSAVVRFDDGGYGDFRIWDRAESSVHGALRLGVARDALRPLGDFPYDPRQPEVSGLELDLYPRRFFASFDGGGIAEIHPIAWDETRLVCEWVALRPGLGERLAILARVAPPPLAEPRLPRWLADLDAAEIDVREQATGAIADLGPGAVHALREAFEEGLSLEAEFRIEVIVDRWWSGG